MPTVFAAAVSRLRELGQRRACVASRPADEQRRDGGRLRFELARQCGGRGRVELRVARQQQLERERAARDFRQRGDLGCQRLERRAIRFGGEAM